MLFGDSSSRGAREADLVRTPHGFDPRPVRSTCVHEWIRGRRDEQVRAARYTAGMKKPVCVVVGIAPKNGEAFVRTFHRAGYRIAMVSRKTDLSGKLASELGAEALVRRPRCVASR
jgi:hypothetical protein